jgi:signal peptide peptidase SppA
MPNELTNLEILEAAVFADARGITGRVPRIEEYFGLWAILEEPFQAAVGRFNALNLNLHIEQHVAREPTALAAGGAGGGAGKSYQVARGGVALIDLAGTMMKQESSLGSSRGTVAVRRAMRSAAADDDVHSILLRIDSPGGTVSGTADLAADVAAAAGKKPVYAFCEDMACSAAYWVASQCDKVWANATALVGSIGTYGVIEDSSEAAKQQGVKVHVIRAGAYKGAGVDGTQVTDEQLAVMQARIDQTNEHFVRGVAKGRKMTLAATRDVADGRAYLAAEAEKKGLIDGVSTLDDVLAMLASKKPKPQPSSSNRSNAKMSDANPPAAAVSGPAAFSELKAACVGADPAFLVSQLEANATGAQATSAWMAEQNKRIASAKSETEAAKAQVKKPGLRDPIPSGAAKSQEDPLSSGDPIEAWHAAVDAELERYGKLRMHTRLSEAQRRAKAIHTVAGRDRALHMAYIAAYPAEHRKLAHAQAMRAVDQDRRFS